MAAFVVAFFVGVVIVVLGISNMRGNISSLHSYHRHRVTEEDRIPFGKMVGKGTIIMGVSVMVLSVFSIINLLTENEVFMMLGYVLFAVGFIIGSAIAFYAMKKYNGGIF